MSVTNQPITQVFLVPYIEEVIANYEYLRWWRSNSGRNGVYTLATDLTPTRPQLVATPITRALQGTGLSLRINGIKVINVTFAENNPYELQDIIDTIDEQTDDEDLMVHGVHDQLVLMTPLQGSAASIEVLSSSAAPYLGLIVGDTAIGCDGHSLLQPGISEYRFTDNQSSPDTWYATDYYDTLSGRLSVLSVPFRSLAVNHVPLQFLIGCFVRLADLTGQALGGRRISIHNVALPNKVTASGKTWSIFKAHVEMVTDQTGYAQILLVRGAVVDFSVHGTGFTRRIKIPEEGTIVDLLDPALGPDDEFGIRSPTIDFAIRTS